MSTSPIEKFVENLTEEEMTDLVLIVAQQDPTELTGDGATPRARWNEDQRGLIQAASNVIDEAGLSD